MFIPSESTVLLTSPEAATRVVLYKKLLLIIHRKTPVLESRLLKRDSDVDVFL